MAQSARKVRLIALAIVVGLGGTLAGAYTLLNPEPGGSASEGPVPGADATLSSTAHT